jgi:hypothetical protein
LWAGEQPLQRGVTPGASGCKDTAYDFSASLFSALARVLHTPCWEFSLRVFCESGRDCKGVGCRGVVTPQYPGATKFRSQLRAHPVIFYGHPRRARTQRCRRRFWPFGPARGAGMNARGRATDCPCPVHRSGHKGYGQRAKRNTPMGMWIMQPGKLHTATNSWFERTPERNSNRKPTRC